MYKIFFLLSFSLLVGCVQHQPSIPQGYVGEKASIEDTFQRKNTEKAYFFCVSKIDGNTMLNGINESYGASFNKGMYLTALGYNRDIPIKPLKISLIAHVAHSTGAMTLLDSESSIKLEGDVELIPIPDMKYFVKGILSKEQTSVWIEDIHGNVVSQRLGKFTPPATDQESAKANPTSAPGSPSDIFSNISTGESVSSITRKLGPPDKISEHKAFLLAGPPVHDFTTYEYKSLGKIQFFGVHPKIRTVEKIIANAPVNDTPETLKINIDAASPVQLRVLARDYSLTNIADVSYLDIMAQKVWDERNNTDSQIEDAVAYLCLTLGRSANAKYKPFLQSVVDSSKSRKIKKYGKQSLDLLPTENVAPFVPTTL